MTLSSRVYRTRVCRRTSLVVVWLAVLFGTPGLADTHRLFPERMSAAGNGPWGVAAADLNGDGRIDIVTANYNSDDVTVLLGEDNGRHGAPISFTVGNAPFFLALADLDGDQHLDLVTANKFGDDISVLSGSGDGSFGIETRYAAGNGPNHFAMGDIDHDGHADLVVANAFGNDLSVLLGKGDGTFLDEDRLLVGATPGAVLLLDLDQDDELDLVVSYTTNDQFGILPGNGDGTFGAETLVPANDGVRFLAGGDFDANGLPDLATANTDAEDVSIFLNDGAGGLGPPVSYPVGGKPRTIVSGDGDGDGNEDLFVSLAFERLVLFRGNGDGSFRFGESIDVALGPVEIVLEDLDGDERQDLVLSHPNADAVSVLLGNDDGSFYSHRQIPAAPFARDAVVADFDGDGADDLAVANLSDDVSVFLGDGNGSFSLTATSSVGDGPSSISTADFDGDGNADLVTANVYAEEVSVLLGIGDGTFAPEQMFPAGAGSTTVLVTDLDGDHRPDLVVSNWLSGDVSVLLGDGVGGFDPELRYAVGETPGDSAVGDLDLDGALDVVVVNGGSNDVSLLFGLGDGTLLPEVRFQLGERPGSLAIHDLDDDGQPDLAVSDNGPIQGLTDLVHVLPGNGDGTFGAPVSYAVGRSSRGLSVDDLNFDDVPDLLLTVASSSGVSALIGRGDGSFESEQRFGTGDGPTDPVTGDFDLDGRRDIAVVTVNNLGDPDTETEDLPTREISILLNRANRPPVAVAGTVAPVECTSRTGATVALEGSRSTDPDSSAGTNDDIVAFDWFEDYGLATESFLGSAELLQVAFSLGRHDLTLQVTDVAGATDFDETTAIVVDTTAPALGVSPAPALVWPANHHLVDVTTAITASDLCSDPIVRLSAVGSDEPDDAPGSGDGQTTDDIQDANLGTLDVHIRVRAERDDAGVGRNYFVTYTASDPSGNEISHETSVLVPHDVDGVIDPVSISLTQSGNGTVVHWLAVPGAQRYDVIRGALGQLTDTGTTYDLGHVECVENDSTETNTAGSPDGGAPAAGQAFIYLVEFENAEGVDSSYGSASAARPRVPSVGECDEEATGVLPHDPG